MAVRLKTPLTWEDIRDLEIGDRVLLSGIVYTARDLAHRRFLEEGFPFNPEGAVIYHCGPLIKNGIVVSAGPTTSARMEKYLDFLFNRGVRGVIGKGGMNHEKFKGRAVYFSYPGGAGSLAREFIVKVRDVYWEDLGMTDAVWELEVRDMPLLVSIDSKGRSLYRKN
ncbi:fumarate hydratase [Pyrococcus furiosus DSM 3638]|uniref:Fumarate hydratase n=3 Tax=Pyrococcus furiosus TaxID=2261 RepID=A0A5C0XRY1_PYRFU|nr:FumA C-terminus/TtdB family hydratase beta subunit [Pyrococcus furiosus]AAL81878.1 possible fumarate hydratase (fumarase) beta subunit [Pyrococcus furiosus DSM 3638]AFN04887.1 fumarate hydratase [Pyrococcus furiosus COM1]QEK79355.1 fumarate hydratase [Pyrococcus furiosus DSM 3638]